MSWEHLFQKLHGIIGALALAAALHPVLLLREDKQPTPRTILAVRLAFAVLTTAIVLGWISYLQYRLHVRGWMLEHHPRLHSVWFEIKEAVGWFAWTAAAAGWALVEWRADDPVARRGARRLFLMTFAAGLVAAAIGLATAATRDLGVVPH